MQPYNSLVSSEVNFIYDMKINHMTPIEEIEDVILRSTALLISENMEDIITISDDNEYTELCIKVDDADTLLVVKHNEYKYNLLPLNSINAILKRSSK